MGSTSSWTSYIVRVTRPGVRLAMPMPVESDPFPRPVISRKRCASGSSRCLFAFVFWPLWRIWRMILAISEPISSGLSSILVASERKLALRCASGWLEEPDYITDSALL